MYVGRIVPSAHKQSGTKEDLPATLTHQVPYYASTVSPGTDRFGTRFVDVDGRNWSFVLFQSADQLLAVGSDRPHSHLKSQFRLVLVRIWGTNLSFAASTEEDVSFVSGRQGRDSLVVRVQDGVNQSSGERSEGSDDSVVPTCQNGFAVVREQDAGGAKIEHFDAEQLSVSFQRPDSHVVLAGSCEHFGKVAGRIASQVATQFVPTDLLRESDVVDRGNMTSYEEFCFECVHVYREDLAVGGGREEHCVVLHELQRRHRSEHVGTFQLKQTNRQTI